MFRKSQRKPSASTKAPVPKDAREQFVQVSMEKIELDDEIAKLEDELARLESEKG